MSVIRPMHIIALIVSIERRAKPAQDEWDTRLLSLFSQASQVFSGLDPEAGNRALHWSPAHITLACPFDSRPHLHANGRLKLALAGANALSKHP